MGTAAGRSPGSTASGNVSEERDGAVLDHPGTQRRSRPLLRSLLGEVLRRTRLEQGRTLADVAGAARVSMPYLSEVERGRKEASSEVLSSICEALQIGLADLLAATGRDLAASGAGGGQILRFPAPATDGAAKSGTAVDAEPAAAAESASEAGQAGTTMHLSPASRVAQARSAMHPNPATTHAAAMGAQLLALRPPEPMCLLAA